MSVARLRFVLGDQLSRDLSALEELDPARDVVFMCEVAEETDYVPHHPKKIAFLFSAMRHFAAALREDGVRVDYVTLDDPDNTGSFTGELARAAARHAPERIVVTEPGEYRVEAMIDDWRAATGLPIDVRADARFLCSRAEFAGWAKGRKALVMEHFYRDMRKRTGLLMEQDAPAGGRWNFDRENRKPAREGLDPPAPPVFTPDTATEEVLDLVGQRFGGRFGDLEDFGFAVTRDDAEHAAARFIDERLAGFGDFQDAMVEGEDLLWHSQLALYLNVGLLDPMALCEAAEHAWREGRAPLNAVEGFIRQILGWREYVRGIYWLKMPDYAGTNALGASRDLPWLYWGGETEMNCLKQCVGQTGRTAYAHHIQRLMVTGNFALLCDIAPKQICDWYLAVYADAFDWVELPNTHGMVMYADGGVLGSKPYAAGGAYIERMSDYCAGCAYDVKQKTGAAACPFNYLYWAFLMRHRETLEGNRRLAMPYATLVKMEPARKAAISRSANEFLECLDATGTDPKAAAKTSS